MATEENITKLRNLLNTTQDTGCSCFLGDNALGELIDRYPCLELAAYQACLLMAQRTDMKLSDGTSIPDQSGYWLRRAMSFRPYSGRVLSRADEVKA